MIDFGKPNQCYKCHVEAVYNSWKKLYYKKENVIKDLCKRYSVSPERFKIASLLTIAFHDAGKTSLSFQYAMSKIAQNKDGVRECVFCKTCNSPMSPFNNKTEPYRHEIISGAALLYLSSKYNESSGTLDSKGFPFEFFAAIGHHKPVNPDSFRRECNEFFGDSMELSKIGYGEEQWNHVMDVAKIIFKNENIILPNIIWKEVSNDRQTIVETVKDKIDTIPLVLQDTINSTGEIKVIGQIRETLALLKSLLISSDWEGSSENQIHSTVNILVDDFWEKVKKDIEQDGSKTFKIRDFQQKLTMLSGHGIAVAPTGSGKTEGAIAWALKNKKLDGKILYVLPNQVLTNSIYERLAKYFGEEYVGLLHNSALLYQILNRLETDEPEQYDTNEFRPTEDEKEKHKLNRMMFKPIMVTTVDQLLMIAFNANKRWAVIMGEVMGGAIIFDEVHAYDGHMLALLERVVRELRNYSTMLFMSATMPKNLIDFLSKLLNIEGENHIVKDISLLQSARNEYIVNEKLLFEKEKIQKEVVDDIEKYIKDGKRVAIVCNTVNVAQEVYKQLTNNNLKVNTMCLHSRFIAKDRRSKENKLEKDKTKSREDQPWPQILVATQVIECGMDIDYDILYTEGAPLEAIIQRAGRVNRERNSNNLGKVYIFKQDEDSTKFYPPEITEKGLKILKERSNSDSKFTEEELVSMIEEVYKDKKFENDIRFLNTRRVLDELIYDIGAVQDLPETDLHTRFIIYKMVEVVPEQFWDDIKDTNQFVIMEHLVKMPLWAYLKAKSNGADEWKVMQMKYDANIGGTFEKDIKSEVLFL